MNDHPVLHTRDLGHAAVTEIVIDDAVVDLIGNNGQVISFYDFGYFLKVFPFEDSAGGVVRRILENCFRRGSDRFFQISRLQAEAIIFTDRDRDRFYPGNVELAEVIRIIRIRDKNLVTRVKDSQK